MGQSIDNIIDQRDDNADIEIVGKLAITRNILGEEDASSLNRNRVAGLANGGRLANFESTWVFQLLSILRPDTKRSMVDSIFDNITIVNFNYDRTVEALIPIGLSEIYGLTEQEAIECGSKLKIFHPYGQVGRLPGYSTPEGAVVPFGLLDTMQAPVIAASIRTFGESIAESDVAMIRQAIGEARNLVFLGFGFHRQNMRLLSPLSNEGQKRVFATVFDMSSPAIAEVHEMCRTLCLAGNGGLPFSIQTTPQLSAQFLKDYALPLTAPI